jgi:hypothetical protein
VRGRWRSRGAGGCKPGPRSLRGVICGACSSSVGLAGLAWLRRRG